jgi:ribosomal protein S18 acetylase RimI-like enzyme
MEIRATTADDWAILKEIRLAALKDAPTAFGVSHATAAAYTDAQWRERAAGPHPLFLLAFLDGEAIGMIGGGVSAATGEYNLIAMWVKPEHRGGGAAAQLVAAIKSSAEAKEHTRIVLDVAPENARAAAFYRRQGFVFLPEWEPLASHPEIQVQKMEWRSAASGHKTRTFDRISPTDAAECAQR